MTARKPTSKSEPKTNVEPSVDPAGLDFEPIEVTARTRKPELVEAYNDLLARFNARQTEGPPTKVEAETKRKVEVVKEAHEWTVERVVKSMADLKLGLNSALETVSQQLTAQTERLSQINEAIEIQTDRLRKLHDIEVVADSLAVLIRQQEETEREFDERLAHKQQEAQDVFNTARNEVVAQIDEAKEKFEIEEADRRQAWEEEQEILLRNRQREADEFDYNIKQQRTRDADEYRAKHEALEKELTEVRAVQERELQEREDGVKIRENELTKLSNEVESFPAKLQQAVAQATETARKDALRDAKVTADMQKQMNEGEANVAKLQIENLKAKVTEQAVRIEQLNKQTADATNKVEKIATHAIEGAAGGTALRAVNEIAMEQAKKPQSQN
ncbi:hypothetical protein ACFL6C_07995 [Myxococcota bacterium]